MPVLHSAEPESCLLQKRWEPHFPTAEKGITREYSPDRKGSPREKTGQRRESAQQGCRIPYAKAGDTMGDRSLTEGETLHPKGLLVQGNPF